MSRPLWHDLLTTDPETAAAFYAELLGWQVETMGEGYRVASIEGRRALGIVGMGEGAEPHWLVNIAVEDVATATRRLAFLQGQVLVEPESEAEPAIVSDPAGSVFALLEAEPLPAEPAPVGGIAWHELVAPRADLGARVYKTLMGWTAGEPVSLPNGRVIVLSADAPVAGLREGLDDLTPSWVPFFRVSDLDAVHTAAVDAGATSIAHHLDIPGPDATGAILRDPTGALFGLLA